MNSGHAVYSDTLERYITGVYPTAKEAEDAAGATPEGHKHRTRKV